MVSFRKYINSLTYNHFLGSIIIICCCIVLFNATSLAKELDVLISDIVLVVVSCGALVFGFFGHFYNIQGAIFKSLTFIAIGAIIIYVSSSIADNNIILFIRLSVGLLIVFGIYSAVNALQTAKDEEDLIKNGYLLNAVLKEVKCINTGEIYLYSIIATAKHPETGVEITFESEETTKDLEQKVSDGDIFKVYMDKKNSDRYLFNNPE